MELGNLQCCSKGELELRDIFQINKKNQKLLHNAYTKGSMSCWSTYFDNYYYVLGFRNALELHT